MIKFLILRNGNESDDSSVMWVFNADAICFCQGEDFVIHASVNCLHPGVSFVIYIRLERKEKVAQYGK